MAKLRLGADLNDHDHDWSFGQDLSLIQVKLEHVAWSEASGVSI